MAKKKTQKSSKTDKKYRTRPRRNQTTDVIKSHPNEARTMTPRGKKKTKRRKKAKNQIHQQQNNTNL